MMRVLAACLPAIIQGNKRRAAQEAETKARSLIESGEEDTDSFELLVSKFTEESTDLETAYTNMDAENERLMSLYERGLLQPSDL